MNGTQGNQKKKISVINITYYGLIKVQSFTNLLKRIENLQN